MNSLEQMYVFNLAHITLIELDKWSSWKFGSLNNYDTNGIGKLNMAQKKRYVMIVMDLMT